MRYTLVLRESQHRGLREHLFPGDGLESAALLLCHRGEGEQCVRLLVDKIILVPHNAEGDRTSAFLSWSTENLLSPSLVEEMDRDDLSLLTIHSHPRGFAAFSKTDDENDKQFFPAVYCWFDDERPHGATVMMPDGRMFGRIIDAQGGFIEMDTISVTGDRLLFWSSLKKDAKVPEFGKRVAQTFGKGTFALLRNLRVGVAGCSGTGSVVIELLARNCIGALTLVDDDMIEEKNLNRIVNAKMRDAQKSVPKVLTLKEAVEGMGLGTQVTALSVHTSSIKARTALKECDVLFGCVDSAEGRYHLESLSAAYLIPYFDVGVFLDPDDAGGIRHAQADARYVCPERGGLLANGVYTQRQIEAEGWRRKDPTYYARQREAKYLAAVAEDQPAVISLNMQAAVMGVNDFLARLHGFRLDEDQDYTIQRFSLTHGFYEHEAGVDKMHPLFQKYLGMGDKSPLLDNV